MANTKNITFRCPDQLRETIDDWIIDYNELHGDELCVSDFFRLSAMLVLSEHGPGKDIFSGEK